MAASKWSLANIAALVVSSLLDSVNGGRPSFSIATARLPFMFATVALLNLFLLAGRAESRMTDRGAAVLTASQKLATDLVARFAGLEGKIGIGTALLVRLVATVAVLAWS